MKLNLAAQLEQLFLQSGLNEFTQGFVHGFAFRGETGQVFGLLEQRFINLQVGCHTRILHTKSLCNGEVLYSSVIVLVNPGT
jgi:hypothetical protein